MILGVWVFLVSEVPLYRRVSYERGTPVQASVAAQQQAQQHPLLPTSIDISSLGSASVGSADLFRAHSRRRWITIGP